MKERFVFLDRDGTVCEDMNYLADYRDILFYPFAVEALKIIRQKGYRIVIITNQSGVARGKFSLEEAVRQKEYVIDYFAGYGVSLDGYYFCPHHVDGIIKEFAVDCDCRKPGTGLVSQAVKNHDVDWEGSYVAGDKAVDMELAKKLGAKGILVLTGHGRKEVSRLTGIDFPVVEDVLVFARKI